MDFAVQADHRAKIENQKRDIYIDFSRELKSLWNIKVKVKRIVIGAFKTILNGLVKGLEDLDIWYHSASSEKPSAKSGVKKSQERNEIPPNSSTGQRHKNESYQSENR